MPDRPPWRNYNNQSAEQILSRVYDDIDNLLERMEKRIERVRAYEEQHQGRTEITQSLDDEKNDLDDYTSRWTSRWDGVFRAIR
jgi:hypothetical protein